MLNVRLAYFGQLFFVTVIHHHHKLQPEEGSVGVGVCVCVWLHTGAAELSMVVAVENLWEIGTAPPLSGYPHCTTMVGTHTHTHKHTHTLAHTHTHSNCAHEN